MGVTFSYGEIVRVGVLMDMTGTPEVEKVQEAYSKILKDLHPEKNDNIGYLLQLMQTLYSTTKINLKSWD